MLNGVDKETGQKLSDDNIKHNVSHCPVNFILQCCLSYIF